ncbi:MAG: methionine biosynthesis protein MetW [SAR86 cluster bacterium]|uniref:Methionine biosynthesis protein MetW n=1 Tax=SAR86 cluster bacterium TaxID=2030880 RepID=A0A2A4MQ82_9GAMM|nr:MAG: methionine biosynthesis protein MetW [SAR86 cluster bacterium]
MRADLKLIQDWINPNSRVLDLGCGDGSLLLYLKETKNIIGTGLEIDTAKIEKCLANGITVIEQNLDQDLSNFQSNSFDTVLLAQTLQALSKPDVLIDQMLRIGKNCIVTFPNFGHWKSRLHLSSKGRMPVSKFMPYQWYDTPNIHFCTVKDFDMLCQEKGIQVLTRTVVNSQYQSNWSTNLWPNLMGEIAIYHITRN